MSPPVAEVLSPALAVRLPPASTVPLPTVIVTEPPGPPVAAPLSTRNIPLAPELVDPVMKVIDPLTPNEPAFTVASEIEPLLVSKPTPVFKTIAPPVNIVL
jgi:hypothetical protein